MTLKEARELVPSEFCIACNTIKINIEERGDSFGTWNSVRNTITLFLSIDDEGEYVYLTKEQFVNTFYHELFHCFNFFYNTEEDEGLAQTFANFMCEYQNSMKK